MHREFNKIRILGDSTNRGILQGDVVALEKLDGANSSFWYENHHKHANTEVFHYGSRNIPMGFVYYDEAEEAFCFEGDNFRGLGDWLVNAIKTKHGFADYFRQNPHMRAYGEWLVKHKIDYGVHFNDFYFYNLHDDNLDEFVDFDEDLAFALLYKLKTPEVLGYFTNPSVSEMKALVGKSALVEDGMGEGIVIRPLVERKNHYGGRVVAKIVREGFQETKTKKVIDPDNPNLEEELVDKYVTKERVHKAALKADPVGEIRMENTGKILHLVWDDIWTECLWDIIRDCKKSDFNFQQFRNVHNGQVVQFLKLLITEISERGVCGGSM